MFYKHFKGSIYEKLFVATDSTTLERVVVYRNMDNDEVWTRPYAEFHGMHKSGVKRFKLM